MTILDLLRYARRKVAPSKQDQEFARWRRDAGDRTLRLDYPLRPDSVVLDVGGYEGQWASDIFARYLCSIFVFEPVADFHKKIVQRFANNKAIAAHCFGLGGSSREEEIHLCSDGSSIYRGGEHTERIRIVDVAEWLTAAGIKNVALLKINIEGGEYELLRRLITTGLVTNVDNIQVQFHNLARDSRANMEELRAELTKTHSLTYQYDFVWENWCRWSPRTE